MKVIHAFENYEQAHLAVSFLENEGIRAWTWDENVSGLLPLFNPAVGMVRVVVDEADEAKATELIQDYLSME